jgi:hypothetical protein
MLLLLHCMLEHVESASGAGTQNKLQRATIDGCRVRNTRQQRRS